MCESYTESDPIPVQTLSAMASSTAHVFDSDEEVLEQAADSEAISPDQLKPRKAVADVAARIQALPPIESPDLDALITDPCWQTDRWRRSTSEVLHTTMRPRTTASP